LETFVEGCSFIQKIIKSGTLTSKIAFQQASSSIFSTTFCPNNGASIISTNLKNTFAHKRKVNVSIAREFGRKIKKTRRKLTSTMQR
jgi:hypothetical protein